MLLFQSPTPIAKSANPSPPTSNPILNSKRSRKRSRNSAASFPRNAIASNQSSASPIARGPSTSGKNVTSTIPSSPPSPAASFGASPRQTPPSPKARTECVPIDLSGRRSAIPLANQILNSSDSPFGAPHLAACRVSLWHPCTDTAANVQAARHSSTNTKSPSPSNICPPRSLSAHRPRAHTATYSNRFAAHIIRQHQFNALVHSVPGSRVARLMGRCQHTDPLIPGPQSDRRVGSSNSITAPMKAMSPAAASPSTSPPIKSASAASEEARLSASIQIPPQVFSGTMRDIDLFVSISTIANDPTWSDGGPDGRFRQYWHDTSFGDLSASAQTRKEVLAALLPRLAIAPQCSLSEKFLLVKGSKRTYKTHLGSGNILMEPNDQYLCIVPNASARSPPPTSSSPSKATTRWRSSSPKPFSSPPTTKSPTPPSFAKSPENSPSPLTSPSIPTKMVEDCQPPPPYLAMFLAAFHFQPKNLPFSHQAPIPPYHPYPSFPT